MTAPPVIAIRADASGRIGSGHVMRCLTLAGELARRGARVVFICREILPALEQLARQAGHEVMMLPPAPPGEPANDGPVHAAWLKAHWRTDAMHTVEALRALGGADWLVVDHYALDARWEAHVRQAAARILVIDDLADRRHDCDVLLDTTLTHAADDYAPLVPEGAQMLLGVEHALLRPRFRALRSSALQRREAGGPVRRILVSFGGGDPDGLSATALRAIAEVAPADVHVDVALGATSPEELGLPAIAADMPQQVVFHDFSSDMARLMHDADLAIGAGGQSTWERCCLGLPAIVVSTATNQDDNLRLVRERKAVKTLARGGDLPRRLAELLRELLADEEERLSLSRHASALIDGKGALRVAERMLEPGLDKFAVPVRKANGGT